jgi:hypothetical protein
MKYKNYRFKKGDKVRMINCLEADNHNKKGDNNWICRGNSFICASGVGVFLEGYSGYFDCNCLKKL